MAVTINDIKKLRDMTGAGLSDCKKALIEAENDMDKALELIRKRGQAIAAKREDREAAQGIAKGKSVGNFAAIIGLKCETDFVAKNEKFVNLANQILDAAVENKVKSLVELNALVIDGKAVPEAITALSGITGEKMELGAYECLEAPSTVVYNHFTGMLSAIVAFNLADVDADVAKGIAMQVASMNPIKATREQVPQATIDEELHVAIEKTKTEQLMADTAAAKEANMPAQMIQQIAQGRLNKFFQENVLMEQIYEAGENKETVAQFLAASNKELKAIDLKRVNLNVD